MKTTFDQATLPSRAPGLDDGVSSEEDPATENEIADEVREEDEEHPPQGVHAIELLIARFDEREVERDGPGEQENPRVEAQQ
jgi:hypothetical protein